MIETVLRQILNRVRARMQTLQPGADPLKELEWVEDQLSKELRERGANTSDLDIPNRDRLEHYGLRSVRWREKEDSSYRTQIGPWKAVVVPVILDGTELEEFLINFEGPDPCPQPFTAQTLPIAKYLAIQYISEAFGISERIREYVP